MSGADLIAAERQRQLEAEGWTPEHDDGHTHTELSSAAACYIDAARSQMRGLLVDHPLDRWPWHDDWWKPSDAEIDRLQRAGQSTEAER